MMIVAGICYVVNTLALIVSPGFWKLINPSMTCRSHAMARNRA